MTRFIRTYLIIQLTLLFAICNLQAQDRVCGSTLEQWNKLIQTERYKEVHKQILQLRQNNGVTSFCDTDSFFTVPVVVHIVYNTPEQNVSDEQVQSQIDAMNEDYAAINATITDVPDIWKSLIKDSKIRFCLAKRNPLDTTNTTGITRTYTTTSLFAVLDPSVKHNNTGGADAWPANSYLNMWVCNLAGGALGYSTFPGNAPEEDGVVIHYKAFGRTGDLNKKYNLGRSGTHETGHWFIMRHTWGDEDNCVNDDGIGDTPLQAKATYGNPSYPKLDACSPNGDGIMFMNYMDYSDDKAMMFFTPEQLHVMDSVIHTPDRDSICNSMGCMLVHRLYNDLELDEIISPVTQSLQRCFQPSVRVRNNGLTVVEKFQLVYNIVNASKRSYPWIGTLLPGATVDITLPSISGIDGLNVLEVRIAETDSNTVNNYRSRSYKVSKENTAGCEDGDPSIYPNPVTSNTFCVKSNFVNSEAVTIRVINILGQKVYEQLVEKPNPGDVFPVILGKQALGVYVVQIINGKQSRGTKFLYLGGGTNSGSESICH